jgi:hypothetical protein
MKYCIRDMMKCFPENAANFIYMLNEQELLLKTILLAKATPRSDSTGG